MEEDTVEISVEARIKMAVENAYRDGWTDRHIMDGFNLTIRDIDADWIRSATKEAMES